MGILRHVEPDHECALFEDSAVDRDDVVFYLKTTGASADSPPISISLTSERESRDAAVALINRRYKWRGYGSHHKLSGRISEATFTARCGDDVIGTVTLGRDGDRGLDIDNTFPEEMRFLRRNQAINPCELKKLAAESSTQSSAVLAAMFHFAFLFGFNNDWGTDIFIEVHPRHASFYEKMLGFEKIGAVRTNHSVCAPAQLLWLPVAKIPIYFDEHQITKPRTSLYRYFLSSEEELSIIGNLKRLGLILSSDSLREACNINELSRSKRLAQTFA